MKYKLFDTKRKLFIWVCLATFTMLFGGAYNVYKFYDFESNVDCATYLSIAEGDFEGQSLIRRYRVFTPFLAKAVSLPINLLFNGVWETEKSDTGALRLGFLIVNIVLMSIVGGVVFLCSLASGVRPAFAIGISLLLIMSGRWATILTGAPLTDNLYMLMVSLAYLGLISKNSTVLFLSLIFGVMAKESFVLLLPVIVFFSEHKIKTVLFGFIGVVLAVATKYYIDYYTQTDFMSSLKHDADTLNSILISIKRPFSLHGIGELFSIFGFSSFLFFIGFLNIKWIKQVDYVTWAFLLVAVAHALLSTEIARMLFLFAAPFAVILTKILLPYAESIDALSCNSKK